MLSISNILKFLSLSIFVVLLFNIGSQVVFAQQDAAGVSISPALIEEALDPGVTDYHIFTITNLASTEETYFLFTRNIDGMGIDGTPKFAEKGEETPFGLASWITLGTNQITLPANSEGQVSFSLSVPQNASPGSHFGGIFISKDAPEIERSGAAVGYQVGNIISVRVAGEANLAAKIRQFSTDRYLYGSSKVDFSARIENQGNVFIRPTGQIEVTSMLGKTVDTITLNESRGGIFPTATREYRVSWMGEDGGFGRYEAVMALSYGEQNDIRTMSSTVTFWILPMNIILPAFGVLASLLLVTYVFVRLRLRRALAQAGHSLSRAKGSRRGHSRGLLLFVVLLHITTLFFLVMLLLFA